LLDRDEMTQLYEDPFHNSRVPDFIAITDHGVICTGGSKLAEHGGLSNDDRNVALLVSSPRIKHATIVQDTTFTTQIAPTILDALDLDPRSLQAVREEGVQVLK
jgi:arylsulfatase A-like enzyme